MLLSKECTACNIKKISFKADSTLGTFQYSILFPDTYFSICQMNDPEKQPETQQIRVEIADTDSLFNHVFLIRTEVFVDETNIDQEDEYDGFDHLSTHFLAWYGNNPAGAARRRRLNNGAIRLERFAVLAEHRGKGIGKALVNAMLSDLSSGKRVVIHSLTEKVGYYEQFGFEPVGEEFEEAGIGHMKLTKTI